MNIQPTPVLQIQGADVQRSPLGDLLAAPRHARPIPAVPGPAPWPATLIGKVAGFDPSGYALVEFEGNHLGRPVLSKQACALSSNDIGREAVLVFENSDPLKPVILGLLQPVTPIEHPNNASQPVSVSLDGEQLTLSAKNEIVLRCGKASITLTRAGKVLIRGAYLLSRSSGANRIKGGSVQIN
jgi:hypothetical protein